jgi:serine/threonine protein phosphatase PrpC/predicted Ser/Thr protein kinase
MPQTLSITLSQHSEAGIKPVNQDFHGAYIPAEPLLTNKGVAVALADGISSSDVSHIASQAAVNGFLEDYFCTSEAWSVKKSAQQVLVATNSWLHAQTQYSPYRFDKDRGYVCTLSAIIFKSQTAHIFHIGDARIYRLRGNNLEQLTKDHRFWISESQNYLARAMGMTPSLDIDYQTVALEKDDIFILMTDGVYEFCTSEFIRQTINENTNNFETVAKLLVQHALNNESQDNLTAQVIKINSLPEADLSTHFQQLTELPFPPTLESRTIFDGYTIVRELHASSRSHVYLAVDNETQTHVVLKTPSIDLRDDPAYLERFLMEEWIARRVNNTHVIKPCALTRKRHFIYVAMEYIEGQTLAQWMLDNPKTNLQTMRPIIEQIALGLRAFHRMEMLHQDLRPHNIMIDKTGTVKIIDFGATRVAGLLEMQTPNHQQSHLLGTAAYSAPEYFLGEEGSVQSDLFSLGVIAYQMITGKLPYGPNVAKIKKNTDLSLLHYEEIRFLERKFPAWADDAIMRAVHPYKQKRYLEPSEFIYDLRHPSSSYLKKNKPPLIERNPIAFWRGLSIILIMVIIFLLVQLKH